jgi:hypothetical protein
LYNDGDIVQIAGNAWKHSKHESGFETKIVKVFPPTHPEFRPRMDMSKVPVKENII